MKTERIPIRVSPSEKKTIADAAAIELRTVSDFTRVAALEKAAATVSAKIKGEQRDGTRTKGRERE